MRWCVAYDAVSMIVRPLLLSVFCVATTALLPTRSNAWGTVSTRTLHAEVFFEPNAVRVHVRASVRIHSGWISNYSMALPEQAALVELPSFASQGSAALAPPGAPSVRADASTATNPISYQVATTHAGVTLTFGPPQARHQRGKPTHGDYLFEVGYRIPCATNHCLVDLGTWEDGLIEPTIVVHTTEESWRMVSPVGALDTPFASAGATHTVTLAHVARLTPLTLRRGETAGDVAGSSAHQIAADTSRPHRIAWAIAWAMFLLHVAYKKRRAGLAVCATACAVSLLTLPPVLRELVCGAAFGASMGLTQTRTDRVQTAVAASLPLPLLRWVPSDSWAECVMAIAAVVPFAAWQWRIATERRPLSEPISTTVAAECAPELRRAA